MSALSRVRMAAPPLLRIALLPLFAAALGASATQPSSPHDPGVTPHRTPHEMRRKCGRWRTQYQATHQHIVVAGCGAGSKHCDVMRAPPADGLGLWIGQAARQLVDAALAQRALVIDWPELEQVLEPSRHVDWRARLAAGGGGGASGAGAAGHAELRRRRLNQLSAEAQEAVHKITAAAKAARKHQPSHAPHIHAESHHTLHAVESVRRYAAHAPFRLPHRDPHVHHSGHLSAEARARAEGVMAMEGFPSAEWAMACALELLFRPSPTLASLLSPFVAAMHEPTTVTIAFHVDTSAALQAGEQAAANAYADAVQCAEEIEAAWFAQPGQGGAKPGQTVTWLFLSDSAELKRRVRRREGPQRLAQSAGSEGGDTYLRRVLSAGPFWPESGSWLHENSTAAGGERALHASLGEWWLLGEADAVIIAGAGDAPPSLLARYGAARTARDTATFVRTPERRGRRSCAVGVQHSFTEMY